MKIKDSFITHNADGEQIMVDSECNFSGIIRNNATAAFIVECLSEDTTEEEITIKLYERYDAEREVIAADVHEVIEKLKSVGAIDE